ncbi:hypothetical protein [Methanoplanus limicola]|uniref:Uncharacterized protein n=1 Tax=Methanoplanus limicola DSM 2279 TaxID=937775 RepID=H1Z2U9_9EURY|nr:hypothetical protein [Methanoplanus limicola]EHQ34688.1 hypothetical protein Metlim_0554 [Methanoplanus limicola DSM 2279]
MSSKQITILIMAGIILIALTLPASADRIMPTSTKVFFEKNGEPYNGTVSFTVTCYGYIVDDTDPNFKYYWRGNYQRREPGTYNQTEVFSYSATVDHYGDEIFEPFYLNYRIIDYCTLSGEAEGKKFVIENAGVSPIPDCKMREKFVSFPKEKSSDVCYISTSQSDRCQEEENELKEKEHELCDRYLEVFDKKKKYPKDTGTFKRDGVTMVITEECRKCHEEAEAIDLNCTVFDDEVSCSDYCDPDGNPLLRYCNLHYTIPTDENGNIIEMDTKQESDKSETITEPDTALKDVINETAENDTSSQNTRTDADDSFFTAIMKFFGLIK